MVEKFVSCTRLVSVIFLNRKTALIAENRHGHFVALQQKINGQNKIQKQSWRPSCFTEWAHKQDFPIFFTNEASCQIWCRYTLNLFSFLECCLILIESLRFPFWPWCVLQRLQMHTHVWSFVILVLDKSILCDRAWSQRNVISEEAQTPEVWAGQAVSCNIYMFQLK